MIFFFALSILSVKHKVPNAKKNVEYMDEGLRSRVEHTFTQEQLEDIEEASEKHEYQAEITKLMNILVDSLYENKDIFLREVISNANDALDKIRFQALRDNSVLNQGPKELEIFIDVDEDAHTITVTDTGIGMTKRDLIENLGRIAKSGTSEFQKLLQSGDTSLIGQFGVGFYSTFLVADKVTVISKNNNDPKQWIWTSDSSAQYTISEDPRGVTLGRGTQIVMHIKPSAFQYLNRDRLIAIARHYSMFVDFPVKIWHFHEETVDAVEDSEIGAEEADEADIFAADDDVSEDSEEDLVSMQDKENEKPGIKKIVWQWEQINSQLPLWLRNPSDTSDSEYSDFYKAAFKDSSSPLHYEHFTGEGRVSFHALLYVPGKAPQSDKLMEHTTRNVRLYVKRVLVADEWEDELLPDYLHFVKGVIDSSDLALNVDRDHLSKEGTLKLIKRRVTSKLLAAFKHLYQFEPGVFFNFYKNYAPCLKYGVIQESGANRRAIAKLLMFYTSYAPNVLQTLDDYVSRMKKGQEKIYYIGSTNREAAAVSPYLEEIYSKGYEVIFAVEPIDLYCLERIDDFDGIKFENPEKQNERRGRTDLSQYNLTGRDLSLINRWFKKVLGDKLERVQLSNRLKATPAICTATNWGYTASHERLIRAQTVHDQKLADNLLLNKKLLELNPEHPTVLEMFKRIKEDPDHKDKSLEEDARLLFDTALLAGGFAVDGVLNYTKSVFAMLGRAHGLAEDVERFEEENKVYYATAEDEFRSNRATRKRQHDIPQPAYAEEGDSEDKQKSKPPSEDL